MRVLGRDERERLIVERRREVPGVHGRVLRTCFVGGRGDDHFAWQLESLSSVKDILELEREKELEKIIDDLASGD